MIVVGTSAVVFPASQIPSVAKGNGALVVEVNLEKTPLTPAVTDIFLQGSSSTILPRLVQAVRESPSLPPADKSIL
jgi:NAD-dependent deacetylase